MNWARPGTYTVLTIGEGLVTVRPAHDLGFRRIIGTRPVRIADASDFRNRFSGIPPLMLPAA